MFGLRGRTGRAGAEIADRVGDQEFLRMMYQEHAEKARQHEGLRATAASLFAVLIAGMIAFAASGHGSGREWASGVMICAASAIGFVLNASHSERFRFHYEARDKYHAALGRYVSPQSLNIDKLAKQSYERKYPITHRLKGRMPWSTIYVLTFVVGVGLTMLAIQGVVI